VRAREGRLLTDLDRASFRITQRGHEVPIDQFSTDRQPVTAALMVQTSGDVALHRNVARAVVAALGAEATRERSTLRQATGPNWPGKSSMRCGSGT
jgi:hypothetical protein